MTGFSGHPGEAGGASSDDSPSVDTCSIVEWQSNQNCPTIRQGAVAYRRQTTGLFQTWYDHQGAGAVAAKDLADVRRIGPALPVI